MSRWKSVVTNQGLNILSNITDTKAMNIVRIKCGSGRVAEEQLDIQTDVMQYKYDIPITESKQANDTTYQIVGKLENANITEGFKLTQIGLYCTLGNGTTEYLYQILQCKDDGDVIPSNMESKGFSATYLINLAFSNSENINIEVVHNDYATQEDLQAESAERQLADEALVESVSNNEVVVGRDVNGKMKLLSVPLDAIVTNGSNNPITSGAVAEALKDKLNNIQTLQENGSITLGGLLIQWGIAVAATFMRSVKITFPTSFSEIYNVQVTNQTLSFAEEGGAPKIESLRVASITETGFIIYANNGNAISGTGYWFAIGKV